MNILENENWSVNSEESDLDSSRLENLHWCSCFECGIALTMRVQERKCCCECKSLLGDKLKDVKCITSNSEFKVTFAPLPTFGNYHKIYNKYKLYLKTNKF